MAVKFQDYYSTLGVARNADDATIKKTYRKLARQYHPDVNKSADAESKFKSISEAYEVLSDPAKRKRYDSLGSSWNSGEDFTPPPGGGAGGFRSYNSRGGQNPFGGGENPFSGFEGMGGGGRESHFSDFFESLFGSSFGEAPGGHSRRRSAGRGMDQESEITISLEDASAGAVRSITITAEGEDGEPLKQSFELKLPRGTPDGARIRVPGKGGPGRRGAAPGDLYLRVHIAPHPIFKLSGRDLEETLDISPWEAVLGAEVDVKSLDGGSRIRLKPGTQSGQKIRLKGKGLPGQKGDPDGDLYAVVRIVVPAVPTPEETELFKHLAQCSKFKPRY